MCLIWFFFFFFFFHQHVSPWQKYWFGVSLKWFVLMKTALVNPQIIAAKEVLHGVKLQRLRSLLQSNTLFCRCRNSFQESLKQIGSAQQQQQGGMGTYENMQHFNEIKEHLHLVKRDVEHLVQRSAQVGIRLHRGRVKVLGWAGLTAFLVRFCRILQRRRSSAPRFPRCLPACPPCISQSSSWFSRCCSSATSCTSKASRCSASNRHTPSNCSC